MFELNQKMVRLLRLAGVSFVFASLCWETADGAATLKAWSCDGYSYPTRMGRQQSTGPDSRLPGLLVLKKTPLIIC